MPYQRARTSNPTVCSADCVSLSRRVRPETEGDIGRIGLGLRRQPPADACNRARPSQAPARHAGCRSSDRRRPGSRMPPPAPSGKSPSLPPVRSSSVAGWNSASSPPLACPPNSWRRLSDGPRRVRRVRDRRRAKPHRPPVLQVVVAVRDQRTPRDVERQAQRRVGPERSRRRTRPRSRSPASPPSWRAPISSLGGEMTAALKGHAVTALQAEPEAGSRRSPDGRQVAGSSPTRSASTGASEGQRQRRARLPRTPIRGNPRREARAGRPGARPPPCSSWYRTCSCRRARS